MQTAATRTSSRLVAVLIGAAVQVLVVLAVVLVWRYSAGIWGHGAWGAYLVGFCLIAPIAGVRAASHRGQWHFTTRQFITSAVLVALLNAVFALSAPGFEEAGITLPVYVGGYSAAIVVLFAVLSTQRQTR